MQTFCVEHEALDGLHPWPQRCRCGADPVGQCRGVKIDAITGEECVLAVERQVRAVLAEQYLGEQARAGASTCDRMVRRRRLADLLLLPAGELFAHVLNDLPGRRHMFECLSDVLTEFAQLTAAPRKIVRTTMHDTLARQMAG